MTLFLAFQLMWTLEVPCVQNNGSRALCTLSVPVVESAPLRGKLALPATAPDPPVLPPTALSNGDFETPVVTGGHQTINDGVVGAWKVTGSVDLTRGDWKARSGGQSLELNGGAAGAVSQKIPTTAGTAYTLSFYAIGNPLGGPAVKIVRVSAGDAVKEFSVPSTGPASSPGWTLYAVPFTASSAETSITFAAVTPGSAGVAIDDVSVAAGTTPPVTPPPVIDPPVRNPAAPGTAFPHVTAVDYGTVTTTIRVNTAEFPDLTAVPWEALTPGTLVEIPWRAEPYKNKWHMFKGGMPGAPVIVRGLRGPNGERPVIDGDGAKTRLNHEYWNEERGLIAIGIVNPGNDPVTDVIIEGLELINARAGNKYQTWGGGTWGYEFNAAGVYAAAVHRLTVRDCKIHHNGDNIFIAGKVGFPSRNVAILNNEVYDAVGGDQHHNSYVESVGATYVGNYYHFSFASDSSALKDRSAGTLILNNWIAGGNRQLDLVESSSAPIVTDPLYGTTIVAGNVLIDNSGYDNGAIVNFGGDNPGSPDRGGPFIAYHNTLVSPRGDYSVAFYFSKNTPLATLANNVYVGVSPTNSSFALNGDSNNISKAGNIVELLESGAWATIDAKWTAGTLLPAGRFTPKAPAVIGFKPFSMPQVPVLDTCLTDPYTVKPCTRTAVGALEP